MKICLVPARSGSKRVKLKNIQKINGQALIKITIKNIQKYRSFKKIYVSSDSKKIFNRCPNIKNLIKVYRSKKLCEDSTPIIDVVKNFIKTNDINENIDICLVYPTSCLITSNLIRKGYQIYKKNILSIVFPVIKFEAPIERALLLNKKNKIHLQNKKIQTSVSQKFKKYYYDASFFYWGRCKSWLKAHSLYEKSTGFIIPGNQTVDVNTYSDLKKLKSII